MGMVGGLCATAPLGWAVDTFGWRPAIACSAVIMLLVTVCVWRTVEDRADCPPQAESLGGMLRASLGLLAMPATWTLILHRCSLRASILGWTLMTLLTALVLVAWPDGAVVAYSFSPAVPVTDTNRD